MNQQGLESMGSFCAQLTVREIVLFTDREPDAPVTVMV
jgi:hypothetical protein